MTWKEAVLMAMEALGGTQVSNEAIERYIRASKLIALNNTVPVTISKTLEALASEGHVKNLGRGTWRL